MLLWPFSSSLETKGQSYCSGNVYLQEYFARKFCIFHEKAVFFGKKQQQQKPNSCKKVGDVIYIGPSL